MKNIKIISIFLVILTLFSFVTINASATMTYRVAIKVADGSIIYYDYDIDNTWTIFVLTVTEIGTKESPFNLVGDTVIYDNKFLRLYNDDIVSKGDRILHSEAVYYELVEPSQTFVADIVNGTITFNERLDGMSFKNYLDLMISEDYSIALTSNLSSEYVYYYGYPVMTNGVHVTPKDYIHKDSTYYLDLTKPCNHDFYRIAYDEKPTCLSGGTARDICDICGLQYRYEIPSENGFHNYKVINSIPKTCTISYVTKECTNCGYITNEEVFVDSGHQYTEATCNEASVCAVCGEQGISALGHNLDALGRCQNSGCTYTWISDKTEDLGSNLGEILTPGKDNKIFGITIPEIDISGITNSITNGINIILALVGAAVLFIVIYYISRMVANFSQARINRPQRTNRKKRK